MRRHPPRDGRQPRSNARPTETKEAARGPSRGPRFRGFHGRTFGNRLRQTRSNLEAQAGRSGDRAGGAGVAPMSERPTTLDISA